MVKKFIIINRIVCIGWCLFIVIFLLIFIIGVLFLAFNSASNEIIIDSVTKTITRKGGGPLNYIRITSKEGSVILDAKEHLSIYKFYLDKNNIGYNISTSPNICCKTDSGFIFKPKPNVIYKISHCSNGDAEEYTIEVVFDNVLNMRVLNKYYGEYPP